jgi:sporadic carbohydrate cluster protein (TIGR04323 family)|tara:strand:+ start:1311 stop:1727 length:417 start_codon:yes stop_codon:yes gene_type:complete
MTQSNELQGYVTSRSFGGYCLPVPMQNLLLRNYCEQNNFNYKLPLVETTLANNYMYLNETINKCSDFDHIGMCSIYMFPRDNAKYKLLKKEIDKRSLNFHFIFENTMIRSEELDQFYQDASLRFLNGINIEQQKNLDF